MSRDRLNVAAVAATTVATVRNHGTDRVTLTSYAGIVSVLAVRRRSAFARETAKTVSSADRLSLVEKPPVRDGSINQAPIPRRH